MIFGTAVYAVKCKGCGNPMDGIRSYAVRDAHNCCGGKAKKRALKLRMVLVLGKPLPHDDSKNSETGGV